MTWFLWSSMASHTATNVRTFVICGVRSRPDAQQIGNALEVKSCIVRRIFCMLYFAFAML
jgi:hypothetical protein